MIAAGMLEAARCCSRLLLAGGILVTLLLIDSLSVQGFREPKMTAILFYGGMAFLFLGVFALAWLIDRPIRFPFPTPLLALLPLVLVFCWQMDFFNYSVESSPYHELKSAYRLYILSPALAWIAVFALSSLVFGSPKSSRYLGWMILVAMALEVGVVLLEIIQNQTGLRVSLLNLAGEIDLMGQEIKERIYGTIGNPNFVAGYLAIGLFPVLGWSLGCNRLRGRICGGWVTSISLLAIIATRSKGGILALVVGGVHYGFLCHRRKVHRRDGDRQAIRSFPKGPILILVIALVLFGWVLADRGSSPSEGTYLGHWLETLTLRGDSIAVRALLADSGFRMWKESPWVGIGAGEFKVEFLSTLQKMLQGQDAERYAGRVARLHSLRANHLHNEYLQILVEWGALGLALVMLFLAWNQVLALEYLRSAQRGRDFHMRLGLLSGFWAALGGSLFDLPFHRPSQAFLLAVLLGAVIAPANFRLGLPGSRTLSRKLLVIPIVGASLLLGGYLLLECGRRYVCQREGFLAQAIISGKIPGGDASKAASMIKQIIHRLPGEGDYYQYLAHTLLHVEKNPNGAIDFIRRARQISDQPELYLLEARAQIEKGNYTAAEPLLAFMETLDRDRPGLHYLIGRYRQARGDLEKARSAYLAEIHWAESRNAAMTPDLSDSYLRLASILEDLGDFPKAVIFYEKFLEKMQGQIPSYPLAQLHLGRILRDHLYEYRLAEKYFLEAQAIFQKQGNMAEVGRVHRELDLIRKRR